MQKIGYLGPKGTFSHEALLKHYPNSQYYTGVEFQSIGDIFEAVSEEVLEEAIVPLENSLEGAINATSDMLVHTNNVFIQAEEILKVQQNLLIKKGSTKEDVKILTSHPQPIGQCRSYIGKMFPNACIQYSYSTADACLEVLRGKGDIAAIASITAAVEYDLEIADRNIQDGENNYTRFAIIGRNQRSISGSDRTSIVFSTEDKPGSLYRILDIFNLWDINMTRIESRPSKNKLGEYIFFIDILGHWQEEELNSALTMVKRKTTFFKLLGSYPIFDGED